jgi:tetratricopeptide (TPR) repeat protein
VTRSQKLARQITAGEVWLPELGYALSLETALAIGTSSGSDWADCLRSRDLEKRLAGCNAFIAESKESSPDVARAYHGRGDAYYSKGDYDRAAADYDRATRLKFAEPYVVQDADGKILPNASPHSPEPPKAETAVATPESPKTETVVTTGPASLSMIAATS